MGDYLAAILVIAVIFGIWWVPRLRIWRRCRCGTQYCTGCGTKRQRLWD